LCTLPVACSTYTPACYMSCIHSCLWTMVPAKNEPCCSKPDATQPCAHPHPSCPPCTQVFFYLPCLLSCRPLRMQALFELAAQPRAHTPTVATLRACRCSSSCSPGRQRAATPGPHCCPPASSPAPQHSRCRTLSQTPSMHSGTCMHMCMRACVCMCVCVVCARVHMCACVFVAVCEGLKPNAKYRCWCAFVRSMRAASVCACVRGGGAGARLCKVCTLLLCVHVCVGAVLVRVCAKCALCFCACMCAWGRCWCVFVRSVHIASVLACVRGGGAGVRLCKVCTMLLCGHVCVGAVVRAGQKKGLSCASVCVYVCVLILWCRWWGVRVCGSAREHALIPTMLLPAHSRGRAGMESNESGRGLIWGSFSVESCYVTSGA